MPTEKTQDCRDYRYQIANGKAMRGLFHGVSHEAKPDCARNAVFDSPALARLAPPSILLPIWAVANAIF